MILEEGDIRIDFSNAVSVRKFDSKEHGLSHCMKAVDFIVELNDSIVFIEIKDPQNPLAKDISGFENELKSGSLIKKTLVVKCRDSYLYEHAMNNVSKPIYYFVLVCLDTLTDADLINQSDILRKHIPVEGPPANPWQNRFIQECMIMNLQTWNKHLTKFPAKRIK